MNESMSFYSILYLFTFALDLCTNIYLFCLLSSYTLHELFFIVILVFKFITLLSNSEPGNTRRQKFSRWVRHGKFGGSMKSSGNWSSQTCRAWRRVRRCCSARSFVVSWPSCSYLKINIHNLISISIYIRLLRKGKANTFSPTPFPFLFSIYLNIKF